MFGYCPGRRRFRRLTGTMVIAAAVLTALMLGGCRKQTYQPTTPPGPQATAASPLPTATTPPPTPMIDYWPPGYSKEEAIYLGGYSYEDWLGEMGDFDTDLDKIIFDAIENAGHRSQVEKLTTVDIDGQSYPAVNFRFPDGDFLIGFDKGGAWLLLSTEGEAWWYDVEEGADIPLYSLPDEKQAFGEKLNPGEYRVVAIDGEWREGTEKAWLKIQLENGDFGFVRARDGDLYGLNLDDIPPMISDLLKMDGYEAMSLTSSGEISDSNFKPGEEIHKTVAGVELSGNTLIRPTGEVLFYDNMAYVRTIGGERQYVSKNDLWGSPALGGEGEQKIKKGVMYPIVAVSSDGLNYQVNARGNIVWVPKEDSEIFGIHFSEIPVSDEKRLKPTSTPKPKPTPKPLTKDPIVELLERNMTHPLYKKSLPGALGPNVDKKGYMHYGADKAIKQWTPIYAPVNGYIVHAGINLENKELGQLNGSIVLAFGDQESGGFYYLQLGHTIPEGMVNLLDPNQPFKSYPEVDQSKSIQWNPNNPIENYPIVKAGELIGYAGGGSLLYGNNLGLGTEGHIEIRLTRDEGSRPIGFFLREPDLVTKENYLGVVRVFDNLAR